MSQAVDAGRAIVLVFNKWDAMDEFDKQRLERLWITEFDRVTWAQRVNLSAKTGWHTNRLASAMRKALESWDQRVPTGKLNAFLGRVQAAHPHPLRGGKQPRILFATQASNRPPAVRDLRYRVPGARIPPVSGTLAARGVRLRGHPDPDLGEHPREEAPQVAPGSARRATIWFTRVSW